MAWQGTRGTTTERGYGGHWQKLRVRILQRDGYLCQTCARSGRTKEASAVDHIVPKSQDGDDEPDNLESICEPCHDRKTANEARHAQGLKPRVQYDAKGFPIWD